jgi:hypothetical protein
MKDPGCDLCGSAVPAVAAFPAANAYWPDNSNLVREAAVWLLCGPCTVDTLEGEWTAIALRLRSYFRARRPEASETEVLAVARHVVTAFLLARRGPHTPLQPSAPIPEDAPALVREGLARRALVDAGGPCPCGARTSVPSRRERRRAQRTGDPLIVTIRHRPGCAADSPAFYDALTTWSATT